MKSILLATASIVAFAGAAAAQDTASGVTFGGDASFGFNDSQDNPDESGFFYEADLNVTFSTTLSNGLVASSTFSIPVADTNLGTDLEVDSDFVLGLSIEDQGGIFLGDVTFAAEDHFAFATMQSADFSEQDSETVLKGTSVFNDFALSASALILDQDGDQPGDRGPGAGDDIDDFIDQISLGGAGTIGRFAFSFGYQQESDILVLTDDETTPDVDESEFDTEDGVFDTNNGDFNAHEMFGVSVGTAFGGADFQVGYGQDMTADTQSYGVTASYPLGPLTIGAEYVFEPDFDEDSYAINASYSTDRLFAEASFGQEVGEEEYDIRAVFAVGEVTSIGAGYNDDDGGFAFVRQGIGNRAYVEASYAEADDVGFEMQDFSGLTEFDDDIREGSTLRVGLEF
jgi:hypothetical protein